MISKIQNEISDLANNLIIRAAHLGADNFVCSQSRRKIVNADERLSIFVIAMAQSSTTLGLWLLCIHLLLSIILIAVAQGGHCRPGDKFTDVTQEALAITIPSIRL